SPAAGQLGKKRLLVVAQGALQLIPFAALPEPESEGRGDGVTERQRDGVTERHSLHPTVSQSLRLPVSFTPLLANHEIVNLPSASTLAALRQEAARRQTAPKTIALLADPIFEKSDERFAGARTRRGTRSSSNQADSRQQDLQRTIKGLREANDDSPSRLMPSPGWAEDGIAARPPADQVFKALAFDANRQIATSVKLSDYRIVHFASHSFIHATHPDL